MTRMKTLSMKEKTRLFILSTHHTNYVFYSYRSYNNSFSWANTAISSFSSSNFMLNFVFLVRLLGYLWSIIVLFMDGAAGYVFMDELSRAVSQFMPVDTTGNLGNAQVPGPSEPSLIPISGSNEDHQDPNSPSASTLEQVRRFFEEEEVLQPEDHAGPAAHDPIQVALEARTQQDIEEKRGILRNWLKDLFLEEITFKTGKRPPDDIDNLDGHLDAMLKRAQSLGLGEKKPMNYKTYLSRLVGGLTNPGSKSHCNIKLEIINGVKEAVAASDFDTSEW